MSTQHVAFAEAAPLHLDPACSIDPVRGHPGERHTGARARSIICATISGLVTNRMASGT
jgi:hypothetical protein